MGSRGQQSLIQGGRAATVSGLHLGARQALGGSPRGWVSLGWHFSKGLGLRAQLGWGLGAGEQGWGASGLEEG